MPLPPPRKPRASSPALPTGENAAEGQPRTRLPEPRTPRTPRSPPGPFPLAPRPRSNPFLVVGGSILLAVVLLACLFWLLSDNSAGPVTMHSKVNEARGWVRLNPLPPGAKNIAFLNPDESSDRRYHIIFEAPAVEIERWLASSPATAAAAPEFYDASTVLYRIAAAPTDPASRSAEVFYSSAKGAVNIAISIGPQRPPMSKFR